jgi:hypothetical protein
MKESRKWYFGWDKRLYLKNRRTVAGANFFECGAPLPSLSCLILALPQLTSVLNRWLPSMLIQSQGRS